MNVYNEIKVGNYSVFEKLILDDDGHVVLLRRVDIPLLQVERDGFLYLILYDDGMSVIAEAYVYLNHHLAGKPINSRLKAASSLRFFYCFLSLANLSPDEIGEAELVEYEMFLRGIGTVQERFELVTKRQAGTINGHYAVVRSFLGKFGIECKALLRSKSVTVQSPVGPDVSAAVTRTRYVNNLRAKRYEDEIPKYISPDEFRALYRIALDKGDLLALVIMHIMYVYGLRLGEVLGLALEDLTEMKVDGRLTPHLILRNRLSDKKFQHAKGRMHVRNRSQYSSKEYLKSKWEIPISYRTYEMILGYVEKAHSEAMSSHPDRYAAGAADAVSQKGGAESSHYVFLNSRGGVLDNQAWGRRLKKYFEEAGIPIDHEPRKNSLSHRFRHGFAMFHAWFSPRPVGILELMKKMRHSNVSSTMVYFNPTVEEQFKVKTEFQEELLEMIPELKEAPVGI